MSKSLHLSRRTILKGLGTAVALPLLDAMLPSLCLAGVEDAAKNAPRRMAFLYVPNGIHMPDWTPKKTGADFELPTTLEVVKDFKSDIQILSGLTVDKARAHGDGPGDHARAMSAFLTGRQPRKTAGADIRVGVSVDQVAAEKIGKQTRFASLEMGCDRGLNSGNCDSGYSCAYSANLSWKSESLPDGQGSEPAPGLRAPVRQLAAKTRPAPAAPSATTTASAFSTSSWRTPPSSRIAWAPTTTASSTSI